MSEPTSFSTLTLRPELLGTLSELGFAHMTLVQAQTLPSLLEGKDVLARAKTGSGKTAAFALTLLNKLATESFKVQALVLCPTRELADQVTAEIRRLARAVPNVKTLSLCGGVPLGAQLTSLKHSPHVVAGTPGRVLHHLRKGSVALDSLQTLVLDEADRMLDMGFADELDAILEFVPSQRQTLLFSATYPDAIARVSARVQNEPAIVDVTDDELPASIRQWWCPVTRENRATTLISALNAWGGALNLVFCNTKIDCAHVAEQLREAGIVAVALHGDLDQLERTRVLVRFANRSAGVLIATDVAARGLDIKDLDAVFNYELPRQAEIYVHRIGRTARAGNDGIAVSLVEERELWRLEGIEKALTDSQLERKAAPEPSQRSAHLSPTMTTIRINGGRKNKLRPGDLLGALTAEGGVAAKSVGSIDLFDNYGYVAIRNAQAKAALRQLSLRPIKGRKYRVAIVR